MASADLSTSSSHTSAASCDDHKRTVDESFLNKMKSLVERLRLENATLKNALDVERSGVRGLKAQYDSTMRNIKTEHRKHEEHLEQQLRTSCKSEKPYIESQNDSIKLTELKKLNSEIQSLKASNRSLQDKLKVTQSAECARAAELRAQAAKHAALELAARKDARLQAHKLLEEIKSKERVIIQLRRETTRMEAAAQHEQAQRMESANAELSRKLRRDQGKEKSNREGLKTELQHRKETSYREAPSEIDSAVSSAPASLSPQPHADMWGCEQCRAAEERAAVSARECARLADCLRDARDQLELMEFRLLELEDAAPDKGARDNLTDSDSGCVSPGSRIKDSASPELKRMDSGYKSPQNTGSPCISRRSLAAPHDDFKEDFARAQVLADILDRTSEASDSLKCSPVKEHLEQMLLSAGSAEDRNCLEQVMVLLYNYQALSSSVSEDECYQLKPRKLCDLRTTAKVDTDTPSHKTQKAIATVSPYSQKGLKCESLDSLCSDETRKPNNLLQESGIFEGVEVETKCTQTENETFEFTGELNTEIQRLNSIREKLEKQGVRNRTLGSNLQDEGEGLECKCVKLGKKHKQYYERRLKFLEGKIAIYEAAQDVKEAKLAQRLQKEFLLENRIQELESQLSELQDQYERLEEDCCELEEIENDTRLHWQQLEMDYELCSAQLRDMTEERECSRSQSDRMFAEMANRECALKSREKVLLQRLSKLEKAVPGLLVWNLVQSIAVNTSSKKQEQLLQSESKLPEILYECKNNEHLHVVDEKESTCKKELEEHMARFLAEKNQVENEKLDLQHRLNTKIRLLEDDLNVARTQITAAVNRITFDNDDELRVEEVNDITGEFKDSEKLNRAIEELLQSENEMKNRVGELERREGAYLEMLTQADDMWAEMEGGYKTKIEDADNRELQLKDKIQKLEEERDQWRKCIDSMKQKMRDIEESESVLRVALDKAERDTTTMKQNNTELMLKLDKAETDVKKADTAVREIDRKFRKEVELLRNHNHQLNDDLNNQKEYSKRSEAALITDFETVKKELNRTCKNAAEMEVTNSELKEEVESLEKQLTLTQKALSLCKRKCDEKIKTLSHELSIKTEELEEMRSESMRQSLHTSRIELKPDRTEYIDEGYTICTAVPKKVDYGRMHHSMSYLTSESKCSCPSMRSQLVGSLIEDLFDRMHNTIDGDLTRLCKDISPINARAEVNVETKAKITNYLLMAISKELVRSIGDADAKTDTEEWQRAVSTITYSVPSYMGDSRGDLTSLRLDGNAGVLNGASRLASVSCACAAARLCTAVPEIADAVKTCQEEVLDHSDVKIMEEQLANAIESIVNCPSCALGTNAIVWSTDV